MDQSGTGRAVPEVDDQGPSFETLLKAGSFQQKLEEARQKRLQVLSQADRNPERELSSLSKPWEQPRRAPSRAQSRPAPQILKPVKSDMPGAPAVDGTLRPFAGPFAGITTEMPTLAPAEPVVAPPVVMTEPVTAIPLPPRQKSLASVIRTYAGFGLGLGLGAVVAWTFAHWNTGTPKTGALVAPAIVSAEVGGNAPATTSSITTPPDTTLSGTASAAAASPAAGQPIGLSQPALLVAAPLPQGVPEPLIQTSAMADALGTTPAPMLVGAPDTEPAFADPPDEARLLPAVAVSVAVPAPVATPADHPPGDTAPTDPVFALAVPASLGLPSDDKMAALPAPPPPVADLLPADPAVAIFLPPSGGTKQNARITAALKDGGFEVVKGGRGDARLDQIEVRYFTEADSERAGQIAKAVNGRAVLAAGSGQADPRRIEVWLASIPKATTQAAKPKATKAKPAAKTQKKQSANLPPMPEAVQIQILRDRILSQLN